MADAMRRVREAGGSDTVRRLIARPIRLDPPRPPSMKASANAFIDAAGRSTTEETRIEDGATADGNRDVVDRLRAEMAVMKAILMAERAESAALRAQIARSAGPDAVGAEARATRDRWAGMVDRLLLSAR